MLLQSVKRGLRILSLGLSGKVYPKVWKTEKVSRIPKKSLQSMLLQALQSTTDNSKWDATHTWIHILHPV